MATATRSLQATSPAEVETIIAGCIAQGYTVASRTPTSATLIKRKEFSVLWAVVGFIFCLLPLIIYLIVYAAQSDQMVVINLISAQSQPMPSGAQIAASATIPVNAPRSPDGNYWWDGQAWQPVQQSGSYQPAPASDAPPQQSSTDQYGDQAGNVQ